MGCCCECTWAPSTVWPRLVFSPPKLCSNSLSWRPLSCPLELQPFTHSVPTLPNFQPLHLHSTQFHYVIRANFSCTLGNKSRGIINSNNNSSGGGDGGGGGWNWNWNWNWNDPFDSWGSSHSSSVSRYALFLSLLFTSAFGCLCQFLSAKFAVALTTSSSTTAASSDAVWEVKGGKWTKLVPDHLNDAFVFASSGSFLGSFTQDGSAFPSILWEKCKGIFSRLMLPEGFPHSVTSDYLEYSLWRGVQGVASQVSGVLATQGLLYAVGLGKGAIPTAAAINWVLKDGIGYLSKIMLSKFGRHFDVNPKGWRLFADLLENFAFGLEILTPGCPHLFVPLGAVAGAGRSAASLIQASTRGCFYAGFAAQRNFAEVIAKGEAQGMVSKSIGIALGIALGNHVSSSLPLALASFSVVTWIHMFCNLKSYQSIQLRTLNPYRASLVFSEYLLSGQAPPVKEVNNEEPLFPAITLLNVTLANKAQSTVLSSEAKDAAAEIETRLELGCKLSDIVNKKEDVLALFSLYDNEGYILVEHKGKFCVVLKENCSPQDMLKGLFQVNYLYWLEKFARIEGKDAFDDCKVGGRLQISLDYAQREFDIVRNDGESVGWVMDGLIARPSPTRIRPGTMGSTGTN